MLFDFWSHFAKMTSKVSINDRVHTVFYQLSWMLRNTLGPSLFDIVQGRKTQSTFTDKHKAFLILFGAIVQKEPQKYK